MNPRFQNSHRQAMSGPNENDTRERRGLEPARQLSERDCTVENGINKCHWPNINLHT